MTQLTEFGKEVKKKLIDRESNTTLLATEVSEKTGLFCDSSYMSRILNGERNAPRIKSAICEILDIKEG